MKQKFKFFFIVIVGLFFLVVGFYFWASSPNMSQDDYSVSGQYKEVAGKPENDSIHSIITYNIGYLSGMTNNLPVVNSKSLYDKHLNKVIYELKKVNADILALQEIDYHSRRSFFMDQQYELSNLGYPFFGKSINWDKKYVPFPYYPISAHFGKILSGQSILSKYPVIELERIELKRNSKNFFYYDNFYLDRLAQVAKIKLRDKTLILINVHLEAFDKATRSIQFRQVKDIYIKYFRDYPTILLGDFNSDIRYADPAISLLLKIPDTGCAAFDPDSPENTFNSDQPTDRLDYIFYNTNFIEAIDARVLDNINTPSDHLPLLMKFKIKDRVNPSPRQQPNT